jgi:sulfate adenylyltransferase subunit 2
MRSWPVSVLSKQLEAGRVLALMPQHRRLVAQAREDIGVMLGRFPRSYVSLSWGKQSIVMAHMAYGVRAEVPCVHWTGEDAELIGDFAAVRDAFRARWPIRYVELPRAERLREAVAEYVEREGMDGVILGLAAEESRARRMTTAKGDRNNIWIYASGLARCCPLARWRTDDLAAYIATHDLPMLEPYRRFGLEVRTSTGAREGSFTERALDLMHSSQAARMRKKWGKES